MNVCRWAFPHLRFLIPIHLIQLIHHPLLLFNVVKFLLYVFNFRLNRSVGHLSFKMLLSNLPTKKSTVGC